MADTAAVEVARRLPRWLGSARVRLAVIYSVLLFGLAAVVVGGIYAGLARSLKDQPVSRTERWLGVIPTERGNVIGLFEGQVVDELALFEKQVNTRALEQLRTYTFGALGLLFAASLGVGWYVSGVVLRPIGRITSVARDIQATDLSRRIALKGPDDELKRLADTVDGMLGRLDDAFESQRRFIHEASHELRNPLAVIRTNVDVALSDPNASAEDLRYAGEVVGRSAARMTTLVDDLLLYARHGAAPTRQEDIDVSSLVADLVTEFDTTADARGKRVTLAAPDGRLPACIDAPAVRRAVANLLANAVRLAPRGSTIAVEVGRCDGFVYASVSDEGPGIPATEQERVFQRFWRGGAGEG
ncbi:MAG: sensor histidine kinase, partial [Acidimicrobiales bacterium]